MQALQIVRGGREPALRIRGTLPAFDALAARGAIAPHAAGVLRDGYAFLRALEHRLQYRDDRQTQIVPVDATERASLAEAMGFVASDGVRCAPARASRRHRAAVQCRVRCAFRPMRPRTESDDRYSALWDDPQAEPETLACLSNAGFDEPAELVQTLARIRVKAAATCNCRRCRGSGSTGWCRDCSRVAAEHRSVGASPNVVVKRLLGPARGSQRTQRLSRPADRASAAAAAARATDGRVRVGGRLPDAPPAAARRAARRARAAGRTRLAGLAHGARPPARAACATTRKRQWTRCAISSTRRRFACSRRISPDR